MTNVKRVENRIYKTEDFEVRICHLNGRDVRADKGRVPGYRFRRKAKDSMTVKQWKDRRFRKQYPGFRVDVLDWWGRPQHGGAQLGTVRESYYE